MDETTIALSVSAALMLILLVETTIVRVKMWREERKYYRRQIERLLEENRQYKELFFSMTDKHFATVANAANKKQTT